MVTRSQNEDSTTIITLRNELENGTYLESFPKEWKLRRGRVKFTQGFSLLFRLIDTITSVYHKETEETNTFYRQWEKWKVASLK